MRLVEDLCWNRLLGYSVPSANLLSVDMVDTKGSYTHYLTYFLVVRNGERDAHLSLCIDRRSRLHKAYGLRLRKGPRAKKVELGRC
jgi:hypothetical protein